MIGCHVYLYILGIVGRGGARARCELTNTKATLRWSSSMVGNDSRWLKYFLVYSSSCGKYANFRIAASSVPTSVLNHLWKNVISSENGSIWKHVEKKPKLFKCLMMKIDLYFYYPMWYETWWSEQTWLTVNEITSSKLFIIFMCIKLKKKSLFWSRKQKPKGNCENIYRTDCDDRCIEFMSKHQKTITEEFFIDNHIEMLVCAVD